MDGEICLVQDSIKHWPLAGSDRQCLNARADFKTFSSPWCRSRDGLMPCSVATWSRIDSEQPDISFWFWSSRREMGRAVFAFRSAGQICFWVNDTYYISYNYNYNYNWFNQIIIQPGSSKPAQSLSLDWIMWWIKSILGKKCRTISASVVHQHDCHNCGKAKGWNQG